MASRYSERQLYSSALAVYDTRNKPLNFDEFAQDVNRVVSLCKLLKQNKSQGKEHNVKLLLNWMIISFNVFGTATPMLLFSVADDQIYPELMSLLHFLNRVPNIAAIQTINGDFISLITVIPSTEMRIQLEREVRVR